MREPLRGERGFTLIEVMVGIVILTFGLLAVADVFPRGLAMGYYGKDQTKASSLAQQEIECLKNQLITALPGYVGDYGSARSPIPAACNPSTTAAVTSYFDPNGAVTTASQAYFTRDVQVQYWTWNGTQFVLPASPYTAPTGLCGVATCYLYQVSVATHWLVRGNTIFQSGQSVNGCVTGGTAVPVGQGCVRVSTFISP